MRKYNFKKTLYLNTQHQAAEYSNADNAMTFCEFYLHLANIIFFNNGFSHFIVYSPDNEHIVHTQTSPLRLINSTK